MTSLATYLANLNAATLAWIAEDPDNRWAGLITEDLSHWAEMGIYTVEQYQRYDLETLVWDMYKDAHGIRPRHLDLKAMSLEELRKEADYLGRKIERQIEADKEWAEMEIEYAYQDALEEDMQRDEMPEKIDYVACRYQEGWL